MKNSILSLALLLSLTTTLGCGKKESTSDKATDKPAAAAPAAPAAPAATGDKPAPAGTKPAPTAADLPAECKAFTDAFEALTKCDKIPQADRDSMKTGYQQMLKAMIDLGDTKASIDGCVQGLDSLKEALKTAGC